MAASQLVDASICSENRVPQAGKTLFRRTSRAQACGESIPTLCHSLHSIFRDHDGLLHTVFSANARIDLSGSWTGSD